MATSTTNLRTPAAVSRHGASPTSAPLPGLDVLRQAWDEPQGRVRLVGAVGCLALLGLIFAPNLRHFVHVWSADENYSHGFLVPLISLYFANEAARHGPVPVRSGAWLGAALLSLAILGRLSTVIVPIGIVGDLSFLLGLSGLVALLAGTSAVRRYGFALFFLVFMVPLPIPLYTLIASPLQLWVSQAASVLLGVIGIPVLRDGNLITLPGDVQLFVAEACSGMRQLTGFLALTTAVAFFAPRPIWFRAILIASSVPVAMTANLVRVMLTAVIMYKLDPKYASGTYHTVEGLLMMGFGLAILAAECWVLNSLIGPESEAAGSPQKRLAPSGPTHGDAS